MELPAPPLPLLLDVICGACGEESTMLAQRVEELSLAMLKFVSDEDAFLCIIPGVCIGEDGEAGPLGGLNGANGCALPLPRGARMPTDGTSLRMPDTWRMIPLGGGEVAVLSRPRLSGGGDSDRALG